MSPPFGLRARRREREADELAARALGLTRSELDRSPSESPMRQAAPPSSEAVLTGQPLDDDMRLDLEKRFAVDLTQVRVRRNQTRATRLGARAYTFGTSISFAPGQYAPHTVAGRRLLAHELAHVVQQQPGAPPRLAFKKSTAAKPFYQEVSDELLRSSEEHQHAVQPILALCQAVDQARTSEIPELVVGLGKVDGLLLAPGFPSADVVNELMARLVLLGNAPAASQVRTWYLKLPSVAPLGRRWARRYYDDEEWHWQEVLERLRAKVDWAGGEASLRTLDGMAAFFHLLEAERNGLDPKEVEADRKRVADLAQSLGGLGFGMETKPYVSIARYSGSLAGLMRDAFVGIQAAFQAVMELATADLAAKRGAKLLDALDQRVGSVLEKLALLEDPKSFEINEWEWRKRKKKDMLRQVDFFPDDKKAAKREITLESYDETAAGLFVGPSTVVDYRRIVAIRKSQIAAVKKIFGLETGKDGKRTAEAKENQRALSATGGDGLQLHSDEDWRHFLLAKFEAHLTASKNAEESLDAVIDLLKVYLWAFTTHSPFNIEDLGDDLLRAQFPRTLTGQLVHDCGVYALRIAYMLSLLRNHPALKLKFRYVQMPVHIGLVITSAVAGLPTYIVNNDDFQRFSADDMDKLRDAWDELDARGDPRAKPAAHTKATDEQFLGEMAADAFIAATELPFIMSEVPKLGGKKEKADKDKLSGFYRGLVRNKVFGPVTEDPKNPHYQFHLRYLDLLDKMRGHHNNFLVPFWNLVAHPAWVRDKAAMEQADRNLKAAMTPAAKTKASQEFDAAVKRYQDTKVADVGASLDESFKTTREAFFPIEILSNKILSEIEQEPAIIAKGVPRASADRRRELLQALFNTSDPWWSREVQIHFNDLRTKQLTPPPYAEEKDLFRVID